MVSVLFNEMMVSNDNEEIVEVYTKALSGKHYLMREAGLVEGHAYHLYVVEFKNRDRLIQHLRNNNIFAQVHYIRSRK